MLDVLDFPKYLSERNNKLEDVKVVCVLNRQINMPQHLKDYDKTGSNIPSLVDLVGIDINNKKYLVKGKAVVMLGPRAYEPTKYGKKVLLLSGTAFLRDSSTNYVEILLIYPRVDNELALYATKSLYQEVNKIRSAYPQIMKYVDELARMNWDFDTFYDSLDTPYNYRYCCSDCTFEDVLKSNQFVFKSEEDYKKSRVVGVQGYEETKTNRLENVTNSLIEKSNDNTLECRDSIKFLPENFNKLENLINISQGKVNDEITKISKYSDITDKVSDISELYKKIKNNWRSAPHSECATGRALFKNVMEYLYPELKSKYDKGSLFIDSAIDKHHLLDIWYTGEVPLELKNSFFFIEVANMQEKLIIAIIDYLLGLKKHLYNAYDYGSRLNIDLYSILHKNPYYFSIIDSRMTIEDFDKLGMLYKVNLKDPEIIKFRNAAYLHNFMLDTNNPVVEENTIVDRELILNSIYNGLIISSKAYKTLTSTGFTFSDKVLQNLKCYIKANLDVRDFMLPQKGWREKKIRNISKYVLPMFKENSSDNVLKDYISVGLGIEYNIGNKKYIIDYTYALKEEYIIRRLYELQINGTKPVLSVDKINQCIRGFERLKGLEWGIPNFKLEDRQADAVRLLYNPILCITGSAGSGKTTTAEAVLYALQALLGIEEENIMFCAPTGKAANRLKEVVKKPTRTIHSLFGIGEDSYTLIDDSTIRKKSEIKVLVVDESSMINLNLMYDMLSKISDDTRIVFLGDRSQLPPIGPGKPFANLLSFLPCVVLNVPKRASERSGITRNAEALLNESDTYLLEDLAQYDDFRLLETPKSRIVDLVQGIVNYHLGRAGQKRVGDTTAARRVLQSVDVNLSPDDIQVVTPINKYEWGTRNLNKVLQDVFNPCKSNKELALYHFYDYEYNKDIDGSIKKIPQYREYRKGDRVIHLDNMSMKNRFIQRSNTTFELLSDSFGIMNGDVGKIVNFIKGSELVFVDNTNNIDEATKESFSDSDDVIYIAVQYQDVDKDGKSLDFIIFYKCDISDRDDYDFYVDTSEKDVKIVQSSDLFSLDLAYALTVHKLQGSQAKLIICVMYPVGYTTFISRNMIYTAITRAEEGLYLVGEVIGHESIINKGRRIEQNKLRNTIADTIF